MASWLANVDWGELFEKAVQSNASDEELRQIAALRRRKAQLPDFAQYADDAVQRRMTARLAINRPTDAVPARSAMQEAYAAYLTAKR